MAEQHGVGKKAERFRDDGLRRHRAELAVDQADIVAVVDQRPADREQARAAAGGRPECGCRSTDAAR